MPWDGFRGRSGGARRLTASMREGRVLKHGVSGFPLFFSQRGSSRVVTSDIWAYLEYLSRKNLTKEVSHQAVVYVNRALEFFEAADNPRNPSRPLLYYYCFLNLAKVFLLHQRQTLPSRMKHGISDPKSNLTPKPRFGGQEVHCFSLDAGGENLFPRFLVALGGQKTR